MTIEVILTPHDLSICRILGNMRTIVARGAAVKDTQMGKQDPLDIDENGVIGEYAFCKHWNIFFDPTAYPRSGSPDCILHNRRFDIKTTTYENGRLTATLKRNSDIDCYALAILKNNKVIFPGWVFADELCTEKNITNLGHGDGYALEQSAFTAWKQ
jgi:hypothetical protein